MQITAIILYGYNGKKRILPFNTGNVNIITGKSKTGKSVIGDIIDYCFGSSTCNIAEGFVREHVAWYGLQIIHNEEHIFIARENPPQGQSSTTNCCYLVGEKKIPDSIAQATIIDSKGLEKILSQKIGISENIFVPPSNQSRDPLSANIRHTLFYCIQNQDEIASQKILFHRQSEQFIPQAIKDTLPYFLGIINENSLALESELSQLKREALILNKSIKEVDLLKGSGLDRATTLLAEAKNVGLLPDDIKVDLTDYNDVQAILKSACDYKISNVNTTGMDRLSLLQSELEKYQQEIDEISVDIRNTEEFLGQVKGYGTEINHQKNRLESIGLFDNLNFDSNKCPFCSEVLSNPLPSKNEIQDSISKLSKKLESVSFERPHLRKHIDDLTNKRVQLQEQLMNKEIEINAIYEENKEAEKLKDLNIRRGRVIGRISLWLESVVISDGMEDKRDKLNEIKKRISEINAILDPDEVEERKMSVTNQLSAMMSKWAKELELEHSEYPYRLDLNKLTVVVDRERPVPLQQLGSGSNWLGCHLIVLFALHTYFCNQKRPVPGFLFLDQPSQVYFPPETKKQDVDSQEIRTLYKFIFERIKELHPCMQVIIVDHADIEEDYFQNAVIEKWWDGTMLVPNDWAK